jgi:hypothetical protein
MNEDEIRTAVVELLFDLHAFNKLDRFVIDSISVHFKVNAEELCDEYGITYKIE